MFVCSFCRGEFENCVLLIHHYRLSHPSLDVFHCEVGDCRRTFSRLTTFGKHLKTKHGDSHHVVKSDSDSTQIKDADDRARVAESSTNRKETFPLPQKGQRIKETPKASVNSNNLFRKPVIKITRKNIETRKTQLPTLTKSKPQITSSRTSKTSVDSNHIGLLFAAKLHNYPDIPRLRVQNIIHDVDALIIDTVEMLKGNILRVIENTPVDANVQKKVKSVFSEFESPLSSLKTEWQCFQAFRACSTYIEPIHYSLGERDEYVNENGVQIIKKVRVTAQFVPMSKVLKKLFELPNIFDKTIDYVQSLKTNSIIISNFVQGSLWSEITSEFDEQEIVFPLFMYFDDYETNNPLGSHKGIAKCGAVYLSIPCLPPKYQSKLANTFLFILFNTLDRETFRNASIFTRAIEELKCLKDVGITIDHPSGPKKIRFVLSLILGDNLGLHSLFGFVTCFRSTYFCRFCLTEYKKLSTIFEECQCVLRNESNYTEQLAISDFTQTGIKEPCIFHNIPNFHVTKNLSVDVMHDVLEGICQYDLGMIFHHYILQAKLFSLSELNDKIRGFFYGPDWSINKPPEILESHIKNKRLMMSSSEMLFLIRHVGLIIGANISHGDEYWDIIVQLKRIVEMVLSPNYHAGWGNFFSVMISEYLELLSRLFPGCLKPKHHFIIHYPRVMTTVGPLWKISSMRFESKHQEGKMTSRNAISRVNVCRTIAVKHQLRVNYRLLTDDSGRQRYQGITQRVSLNDLADGVFFAHLLSQYSSKEVLLINRIEFQGRLVTKDSVIMRPSENGPEFFVVNYIIVEENGYCIVAKQLHDCHLDYHTQAYQIMRRQDYTWQVLRLEERTEVTVTHIVRFSNACNYIIKNWF